jgi:GntR family transcriptional regulator of arabinose operon
LTEKHRPKYQEIVLDLRKAITLGEYKEGQRLPSEAALVKRFSTSRITVQRALKDLQHQGLIDRRAGSGTFVRRIDRTEKFVFGLLIPGLGETEIFEPICQGMARAGRAGGHALLWGDTTHTSSNKEQQTRELCEYYISRDVTGVFFAPVELTPNKDAVNLWILDALEKARIPVVLLDRCIFHYPNRSSFDLVGIDNRRAGYTVTKHLLNLGCKHLVFLAVPYSAPTVDARIDGFRDAIRDHGLKDSDAGVHIGSPDDTEAIRTTVSKQKPDGFVCANDRTAAHLMRTLDQLGIRIPEEIRIVGIDDVRYAALLGVPLTTVRQPWREIGEVAITLMLDRITHPGMPSRDILLDCKLVVRKSCGSHLENNGNPRKSSGRRSATEV